MRYHPKLILLVFILVTGVFFDIASAFTAECPEGYKCLTEEKAKETAKVLDEYNCMVAEAENGDIDFEWKPNQITITHDGQVFAKEEMVADLKWCSWHLQLTGDSDVLVHQAEAPNDDWGFRLRVRLGVGWYPTRVGGDLSEMWDPMILLEPFHVRDLHLQTYAGLKSFGLTAGWDLTRNMDVYGGVGLGYRNAEILPVLGVSLSFN